jgi:hypothetical protein
MARIVARQRRRWRPLVAAHVRLPGGKCVSGSRPSNSCERGSTTTQYGLRMIIFRSKEQAHCRQEWGGQRLASCGLWGRFTADAATPWVTAKPYFMLSVPLSAKVSRPSGVAIRISVAPFPLIPAYLPIPETTVHLLSVAVLLNRIQ